jgi:hypothetical protein
MPQTDLRTPMVSALGAALGAARRRQRGALFDEAAMAAVAERIEDAVRCYESEYRGFLGGDRRQPPSELASALSLAFQVLAAADHRLSPATYFRIEAAESRFHAAKRLFCRVSGRTVRRND